MKRLFKYLLGILLVFSLAQVPAKAAEYEIIPTNAILTSNEKAILYSDAALTSQIILDEAAFPDNVPVNVTGITSTGFYQVDIGGVFYIPGYGLTDTKIAVQVEADSLKQRQQEVYNLIIGLKTQFPEGTYLTNETFFYPWHGGFYSGGYGCAGYAFYLSDYAFGDAKTTKHRDYNDIKIGDILRINNDTHSVVVIEVKDNSVIVTEGNYNSSVHWGRELTKASIQDEYSYIMTRY